MHKSLYRACHGFGNIFILSIFTNFEKVKMTLYILSFSHFFKILQKTFFFSSQRHLVNFFFFLARVNPIATALLMKMFFYLFVLDNYTGWNHVNQQHRFLQPPLHKPVIRRFFNFIFFNFYFFLYSLNVNKII